MSPNGILTYYEYSEFMYMNKEFDQLILYNLKAIVQGYYSWVLTKL